MLIKSISTLYHINIMLYKSLKNNYANRVGSFILSVKSYMRNQSAKRDGDKQKN